jgi:Domain of unknown function (DUF4249)
MKYISFFSLILLLLSACVPEPITIVLPEEPKRIIVSSQVLPDRGLVVLLTNSVSSLNDISTTDSTGQSISALLLDKAYVTLSFDGKTEKLVRLLPGIYGTLNLSLETNKNYTLYVKDSLTGREVTATTTFTPPISLDSAFAKLEFDEDLFGGKDTISTLNLVLTDSPGQKNYYMLDYVKPNNLKTLDLKSFGAGRKGAAHLFTSDNADANHKIRIKETFFLNPTDTLIVALFKITKEYYEFQNGFKKNGGIIGEFLGEPVTIPTNVKNGHGFFNLAYPSLKLVLPKW